MSPSQMDAGWSMRLAQKVELTLQRCLNSEPRNLAPHLLLVAPENRDGAPPNVQYIHHGILRPLAKAGFDRNRRQVGICVRYSTSEGKAGLLAYNRRFTSGKPPPAPN